MFTIYKTCGPYDINLLPRTHPALLGGRFLLTEAATLVYTCAPVYYVIYISTCSQWNTVLEQTHIIYKVADVLLRVCITHVRVYSKWILRHLGFHRPSIIPGDDPSMLKEYGNVRKQFISRLASNHIVSIICPNHIVPITHSGCVGCKQGHRSPAY